MIGDKILQEMKKIMSKKDKTTIDGYVSHMTDEKIYADDVVSFVQKELQRRKFDRMPVERQWLLNANFLAGNQYCDIADYRAGDIDNEAYSPDWIQKETFNRISPLIEARIANLKKLKFKMNAVPATDEDDDFAKAEITSKIIRFKQKNSQFEEKIASALVWNEICGNAFLLSWWNPVLGDAVTKDENNYYFEGDVDYNVISPYEVYPDNMFSSGIDTQRSIIIEQVKSVEEIYDLYSVNVKGEKIDSLCLSMYKNSASNSFCSAVSHCMKDNSARVITYFEVPSRRYPKGRMIIICADKLIHYSDLPYSSIPLVQFKCKNSAGQFFSKSIIEDLIPLQKAYNSCVNRIHEYIKRIAIGEYFVEEGSIDIEEYEENGLKAGALLVYKEGSQPPVRVPSSSFPNEALSERIQLQRDMEYVSGISQLMVVGSAPSGVVSGTAMETLRDIDNIRLASTGDYIRAAIKDMAKIWLSMYKQFAKNPRVLKTAGYNNLSDVIVWTGDDVTSFDVEFAAQNELTESYEAQKQKFLQAYSMGLFTDEHGKIPLRVRRRAQEFLNLDYAIDIADTETLQEEKAKRENVLFERNVVPTIEEYDDHRIHYEEHMRYALQTKFYLFEKKNPDMAKIFKNHIKEHKKNMEEMKNI